MTWFSSFNPKGIAAVVSTLFILDSVQYSASLLAKRIIRTWKRARDDWFELDSEIMWLGLVCQSAATH